MSESVVRHWFIQVDRCKRGFPGIFAHKGGSAKWWPEDHKPNEHELHAYLGSFDLILHPEPVLLTEEELHQHCLFTPLLEYRGEFGISYTREVVAAKTAQDA